MRLEIFFSVIADLIESDAEFQLVKFEYGGICYDLLSVMIEYRKQNVAI